MILADTNFLVDFLRKKVGINQEYDKEGLFTSEVCVFELYFGLYSNKLLVGNKKILKKRIDLLENLLVKFQVLPFGRMEAIESAIILGKLKLDGIILDYRDCMIAGTGLANGINKILTRNKDHFNRIPGIQTISYSIHN